MRLTVKNLRGIESAEIDISRHAIVCGANGAGKTSIATATAACLMGTASPLPDMLAKDARLLLRDGTKRGVASLDDRTVNWPGGTVSGCETTYSGIVAGVESLATMPKKQRIPWLVDTLAAEPSMQALTDALTPTGAPAAKIVQAVEADGWDAAEKRARTNATEAKGAWQQITGENYGSQKAQSWRPERLTVTDGDALKLALDNARAAYDAAVAGAAVSQAEVNRLRGFAAQVDALTAEHEAAEREADAADQAEREARSTFEAIPVPGKPEMVAACPECGAECVVVSPTSLRKPMDIVPDDGRYAKAQQSLSEAHAAMVAARNHLLDVRRQMNAALDAVDALKNMPTSTSGSPDAARQAMDEAEAAVLDYNRWIDAGRKHKSVLMWDSVAAVLAPSGLRQQALDDALAAMNAELVQIAARAGWKHVTVSQDGDIDAGGTPYWSLSASEQFRVRVVLQVWQRRQERAPMIVVDAADILDKPGRVGLMRALSDVCALITMTYSAREECPKPRDGMDVYWLSERSSSKI